MLNAFAAFTIIFAFSVLAQAQATRTWVSGVGDDANPCSRTAPCKTFAGAISKTAASGEIDTIDPGGFGTVTITKSITIDGAGTMGSILAALTNGVIVNDTSNAAIVTLRNLSINGAGNGLNGVRFLQGKSLTLQNVEIFGFTGNGIDAPMNAGATGGSFLFLSNVNIRDLRGASSVGVRMSAPSNFIVTTMDQVRVERGATGIQFGNNASGAIRNSLVAFTTANGVEMVNGAAGGIVISIENTLLNNNGNGISAGTGTTTTISNCNLIRNNVAIANAGGTVVSSGNNRINSNGSDGLTPTIINPK
jgi:hypothetical protein